MTVERPDLRLLPPAAACWLAVYAAGWLGPHDQLVAAGALAAVAVGTVCLGSVAALRSAALVRRVGLAGLAAALLAATAGMLSAGVRDTARAASPLAALAAAHADAEVRLRVAGDPKVVDGESGGRPYHLVIVAATALRVDADDGRSWSLSSPLLVLATDDEWSALQPSQQLHAVGGLEPPRSGDAVAAVLDARGPPDHVGRPSALQRAAGRVRADLRASAAGLPGQQRALLPALVDGDTSGITSRTSADFRATGLTHLVAVSGENLAIVTGVVLAGIRRARLGPRAALLITMAVIVGFVVVARPSPSVLRAAVMGGLAAAGLAARRPGRALRGLAFAVLVLVLVEPQLAREAGFALSVLASLGLLVLAPGLASLLGRRLPEWLATALAVPWAAQVACMPVIAAIGGGVSLTAVPANLLVGPAVAPATLAGVAAALLGPVWPWSAGLAAHVGGVPCWWLLTVAHDGARVPLSTVSWPGGATGAGLCVAVTMPLCWLGRRAILRT